MTAGWMMEPDPKYLSLRHAGVLDVRRFRLAIYQYRRHAHQPQPYIKISLIDPARPFQDVERQHILGIGWATKQLG